MLSVIIRSSQDSIVTERTVVRSHSRVPPGGPPAVECLDTTLLDKDLVGVPLVLGKIWVDTYGELVIENHTNGWKTVLEFVPCGYFGAGRYVVKGNVTDAEGNRGESEVSL